MSLKTIIQDSLTESAKVNSESSIDVDFIKGLELASTMLIDTFQNNGKILLAGNGGSAADSQHIAAEFIGRLNFDRDPLPAIALTANTSNLTCIANDYGYDEIFSRQAIALAQKNGYYAEEELEVTLEEGRGSSVAAQLVATGQSELGYADAGAALNVASKGAPIKIISTIWKSGQFGIQYLENSGIKEPKDLIGKKLSVPPGSAQVAQKAYKYGRADSRRSRP
mgnify:CR=1 FL=1